MSQFITYQRLGEHIPSDPFRSDWIFILTIIPLLLFLIVASTERKSITSKINIFYNPRYANTLFRNAGAGRQIGSFLAGAYTLISVTTIIFFAQIEYNFSFWELRGPQLWFANLAIVSGAIIFRYTASFITGEITGKHELFREYMFNIVSFYKFLGIILVVINILIPYLTIIPQKILIILALILFLAAWLFRLIRLISIFIRGGHSLFYLILYLCALEFAPILIFGKFISGTL